MQKKLTIIDNDGFLALVDAKKYQSYYSRKWSFEQLTSHFVDQSNQGRMIIWSTGHEGDKWNVIITQAISKNIPFREFVGRIEVTAERLYLTEYADLTMAASYQYSNIPSRHNSDKFITLENGFYIVLIRQFFNPELDYSYTQDHFEIVFTKTDVPTKNNIDKITWY